VKLASLGSGMFERLSHGSCRDGSYEKERRREVEDSVLQRHHRAASMFEHALATFGWKEVLSLEAGRRRTTRTANKNNINENLILANPSNVPCLTLDVEQEAIAAAKVCQEQRHGLRDATDANFRRLLKAGIEKHAKTHNC